MALTIATHPSKAIINDPEFEVTTSLTEGASYNNLRVRAEVYMGGRTGKIATIEQPKGLSDWDFKKLLDRFIRMPNFTLAGSSVLQKPTLGSELLTGWTGSGFTTFTTAGREIILADGSNTGNEYAISNDLGALSEGDILIVGFEEDYSDTGANPLQLFYGTTDRRAKYYGQSRNKIAFIRVKEDIASPVVSLGNASGDTYFSTTVTIKKITDFINDPCVYFHVKFTEYYEDASGVTTAGASSWSDTLLYIPALMPDGENFTTDYLLAGTTDKFLNKGIRNGETLFKDEGHEMRVLFATDETYINVWDSDAGFNGAENNPGYGYIVVNNTTMGAATSIWEFIIYATRDAVNGQISESLNLQKISDKCFEDSRVLLYKGDLGPETMFFAGQSDKRHIVDRETYRNSNYEPRTISTQRRTVEKLRTGYQRQALRDLLKELISSEITVWMIDNNLAAGYREIAVTSDEVLNKVKDELIQSEIDIEYHE